MGASRKNRSAYGFRFAGLSWGMEFKVVSRAHWVFLVFSGLFAGFLLSVPAQARDLNVIFEKDVAAVTPDMEVLPSSRGSLSAGDALDLSYQTTGLKKLKEQGINIWAEEATSIGGIPSLSATKVLESGLIIPEESTVGSISHILAEQRVVATDGMVVYLDIGKTSGLTPGDRFTVFSKKRVIRHPVEKGNERVWFPRFQSDFYRESGEQYPPLIAFTRLGKKLGTMVRILGFVDVLDVGMETSKAIVQKTFDDIRVGDLIVPYQEPVVTEAAPSSGKTIEGYVVAFKEEMPSALTNDIVYIDRGSEQGVKPGDIFQIYVIPEKDNKRKWFEFFKPKMTPLTPLVIGELQVIATQLATSTALVLDLVEDLKGPGQFVRYKP